MCAVGLYLAFLLLEDMFVGNYSTNTTQDQNLAMRSAYNTYSKNMLQRKNITKRSIGKQNTHILNTIRPGKSSKKLQVRNITQTYELINMLWTKTKAITGDSSTYTTKRNNSANALLTYSPLKFLTSTPSIKSTSSMIEFYYMDDIQHSINDKKSNKIDKMSTLPFLIFHIKGPYIEPISLSKLTNHSRLRNNKVRISAIRLHEVQQLPRRVKATTSFTKKIQKNTIHDKTSRSLQRNSPQRPMQLSPRQEYLFDSNALMKRAIPPPPNLNSINYATIAIGNRSTESTTIYDKIKFFETYDQFTHSTLKTKKDVDQVNSTESGVIDNNKKILLEHVDQGSHDHVEAKHEKKHITENPLKVHFLSDVVTKSNALTTNDAQKRQLNGMKHFMNGSTKSEPNSSYTTFPYVNETARWSDYPFAAVYIYEPSQVHCDAAAINTHWLIASGSCLSRVKSKANAPSYGNEVQSAFVTYCGEQWWEPERVAYVKYTVVHPWYHPRDKTRQHLYNIGAIQVVNSLVSACAGWAPAALMSHQYAATADTTWAMALGWGLDRFDTRYGTTDLPKTLLMAYKSVVYFDSCPGNVGYSKAKRLDKGGGVKNVHCLLLPPYYGEDADPVHGGLLIADGKLIALYLQEERRPWGDQSAQYTSVWRLIPWLMDIAREPEQIDNIIFEL